MVRNLANTVFTKEHGVIFQMAVILIPPWEPRHVTTEIPSLSVRNAYNFAVFGLPLEI